MTADEFITKWKATELKERSAAQSHFIDLCRVLHEPSPTDADPKGEWYCFERGASKTTGGEGWADVWKRNHFGWEYKGKRKDLKAAFVQLQQYALALENPPLLVVCDMDRFEIHTNWTNSISEVHQFSLDDLRDAAIRQKLKWVLSDPEKLRPDKTREALTEEAAAEFATLAQRLRDRGHNPHIVAHFVNRLVFCMFAEDVDLLPNKMFRRMLEHAASHPKDFEDLACDLFAAMRQGGRVGFERVDWFNGGLFDNDDALPLESDDIKLVLRVAQKDWSNIDPSIFGTLFERGLDPDKRSQLGAHYTDREKIMQIVDPVIVRPLMAEWEDAKTKIAVAMERVEAARTRRPKNQSEARRIYAAARREEEAALREATQHHAAFVERLRKIEVLDPACGSGNFLYLALRALKDIEHRANLDAETFGLGRFSPVVGPEGLRGIEINPFAAELARITVWIGEIQWMRRSGFDASRNPILRPLDTIECRDAVLNPDGSEAAWPAAEFIIGNPPFLGAKLMRQRLGPDYTERLRAAYKGRLRGFTDLVCYWFEKARCEIAAGRTKRAGLVATSSIRGGTNRPVLDEIARTLTIHEAWSEEPWTIEGARVEVSLVCFCDPAIKPEEYRLNGQTVPRINADLTSGVDLTRARVVRENTGVSFLGIQTSGPLDIPGDLARQWLKMPSNPNGRHNREILRPYWNGEDVTGRPRDRWLIDFPSGMSEAEACAFEAPYEYLAKADYAPEKGKPPVSFAKYRLTTAGQNPSWWEAHRPRPKMRQSIQRLPRYIVTTETSEHRLFIWLRYPVLPDKNLIVFARDDDTAFGILHSRFHELWALRLGTSLEDRPRYTSTTTFATFPFPDGLTPDRPASSYVNHPKAERIAAAARTLVRLRDNWLNPPELVRREPEVAAGLPDRLVSIGNRQELRHRTLTELYNTRPAWLAAAHHELDETVADAYGVAVDVSDDVILSILLELNQVRAAVDSEAQVQARQRSTKTRARQ